MQASAFANHQVDDLYNIEEFFPISYAESFFVFLKQEWGFDFIPKNKQTKTQAKQQQKKPPKIKNTKTFCILGMIL